MPWIESHQSLGHHPKTNKVARILGISSPAVVGHLQYLWWWALDYAEDGDITKYGTADIADGALWEEDPDQFMDALVEAGFIDNSEGERTIHDWDDYAGKLIAQRRANRERVRRQRTKPARNAHVPGTDAACNGATVPNQQNQHNRTNITEPDLTTNVSEGKSNLQKANESVDVTTTRARRKTTNSGDAWKSPDWWKPLEDLEGYQHRDYTGTREKLEVACRKAGVAPGDLVKSFADYYRLMSDQHNWADPVAALRNPRVMKIQLSEVNKVRGSPDARKTSRSGRSTKAGYF